MIPEADRNQNLNNTKYPNKIKTGLLYLLIQQPLPVFVFISRQLYFEKESLPCAAARTKSSNDRSPPNRSRALPAVTSIFPPDRFRIRSISRRLWTPPAYVTGNPLFLCQLFLENANLFFKIMMLGFFFIHYLLSVRKMQMQKNRRHCIINA